MYDFQVLEDAAIAKKLLSKKELRTEPAHGKCEKNTSCIGPNLPGGPEATTSPVSPLKH
jgi:hypothetical protein